MGVVRRFSVKSIRTDKLCFFLGSSIDVDYPMECDDEYWTHPDPVQCFIQPEGKPTNMSWSLAVIKLREIQATASRTIVGIPRSTFSSLSLTMVIRDQYSTRKSRFISGLVGPDWEQRVVADLDSLLHQWQDQLPSHCSFKVLTLSLPYLIRLLYIVVKWDPERSDDIFFAPSASLAAIYYSVQIFVHRRFVSSGNGRPPTPVAEVSRVICVNSARMCARICRAILQHDLRNQCPLLSHLMVN